MLRKAFTGKVEVIVNEKLEGKRVAVNQGDGSWVMNKRRLKIGKGGKSWRRREGLRGK